MPWKHIIPHLTVEEMKWRQEGEKRNLCPWNSEEAAENAEGRVLSEVCVLHSSGSLDTTHVCYSSHTQTPSHKHADNSAPQRQVLLRKCCSCCVDISGLGNEWELPTAPSFLPNNFLLKLTGRNVWYLYWTILSTGDLATFLAFLKHPKWGRSATFTTTQLFYIFIDKWNSPQAAQTFQRF